LFWDYSGAAVYAQLGNRRLRPNLRKGFFGTVEFTCHHGDYGRIRPHLQGVSRFEDAVEICRKASAMAQHPERNSTGDTAGPSSTPLVKEKLTTPLPSTLSDRVF
jgi:hypothetical protein